MQRYGLLGEKLGHSYSPQLHAQLASYPYDLYEVAPERLDAFLRMTELAGMNVTIPYKKAVIPYCKALSPAAARIGSVNTLVRRADGWYGDNTDYDGFCYMARDFAIAGKKALETARETTLAELRAKAAESGLSEDAQAANDYASLCDRFEKKLHDLALTRTISIQMAPQIRLIQNSNTLMVEKIQSTIHNTIPLWKNQMVLALGMAHSQQAMEAQREVNDLTNALLKKNADALKTATVETAKESERGIVDMETLKHTNESLISTLDEVMRIQDEGRQKRREAEAEIGRIEGELKQKLLQLHN